MEAVHPESAADIAPFAKLIQVKHQEILARIRADNAGNVPGAALQTSTPNPVRTLEKSLRSQETKAQKPPDDNQSQHEEREAPQARESRQAGALSPDEQRIVDKLRARDREVRDHEQAHARVGGSYASQPTYSYQSGPDGKRYAIGGSVAIDASPVRGNPEATIVKMEVVKRAALAPAEPSSTDRRVAAFADSVRAQAIADLANLRAAERNGEVDLRI